MCGGGGGMGFRGLREGLRNLNIFGFLRNSGEVREEMNFGRWDVVLLKYFSRRFKTVVDTWIFLIIQ